jgi:GntR family transcriptional regulator
VIIRIEPESEIPIYIQLTNQIIENIAKGSLAPGESLPSVRAFAADLGVNMHTVNKSYHELEKKGIIEIIPKSGAIICKQREINPDMKERIYKMLKPTIAEAIVLGMTKEEMMNIAERILQELKESE